MSKISHKRGKRPRCITYDGHLTIDEIRALSRQYAMGAKVNATPAESPVTAELRSPADAPVVPNPRENKSARSR